MWEEDVVQVLVRRLAGGRRAVVRDEADGVDALSGKLHEDDGFVARGALNERLADLPDAEVDGANERDESDRAFEPSEETLAEAPRGEVAEEGDTGGDEQGREQLGDDFDVPGVGRQPRRAHEGIQQARGADEDELQDEQRHRERCHQQETSGETGPEPAAETHTGRGTGARISVGRRIATPYSGAGQRAAMFTGIVEGTGEVVGVDVTEEGRRLRIRHEFDAVEHGQSISVSGVCLTVEAYGDDWFSVFLASETVEKTYLGTVEAGDPVNLERAMPADGRFDGHIVQGHVDGVATVEAVERVGDDWWFEFALPPDLGRYVVSKGSIALDGISLTVADLDDDAGTVAVAIIPTTYDLTTLSAKEPGDPVHVEVDVVAKYVERLVGEGDE
mgnify:CR=1 FL=1